LLGATKFDAHGFAICLQPLCHRLQICLRVGTLPFA
jgi:hypothetical protein